MSSRPRQIASLGRTAVLLSAMLALEVAAAAQTAPDYSRFTAAKFIPFTQADSILAPRSTTPKLRVAIGGQNHDLAMDTGSTGIMLPASVLPAPLREAAAQCQQSQQGWEFLSSSKLLWVGCWIPTEVQFLDTNGAVLATAAVPVLAIQQEVVCPHFSETANKPVCPGTPLGPAKTGISYMGVGFGREHDGQPQGTPDKNPLLNITRIENAPVQQGTMRNGYIITSKGVHVGLTSANTAGFAYMQLAQSEIPGAPRDDWQQASICVMVDGSPCVPGSVLIDTGIPQMYLSIPENIPVRTVKEPDLSNKEIQITALREGSQVTVRFPGNDAVAFYTFTVGDRENLMTPAQVILPQSNEGKAPPTFVNTGRHFLRRFDVLFDAYLGLLGLRWTGPAGSPEGGLVAAGSKTP